VGPGTVDAGFRTPAQAEGRLAADGLEWALLVFHEGGADVALDAAAGSAADTYPALRTRVLAGPLSEDDPWPSAPSSQDLPDGVHADAAFPAGRWASLLVVADAIALRAGPVQATLAVGAPNQVARFLPPGAVPADVVRTEAYADAGAAADSAGLALAADGGFPFTLEARGVRRAEWYNATVACPGSPCPDAPGYSAHGAGPAGASVRVEERNYTALVTSGGSAAGSGRAMAAAVGGGRIDVAVAGGLRLPEARLDPCPDPCAPGGTLRAEGNVTLAGLQAEAGGGGGGAGGAGGADGVGGAGGGRMHARLGGSVGRAAVDEAAVPDLLGAGLVAGGAAVGLLVALKVAFALFLRRKPAAPAEHPRRDELQRLVVAEPGLSFRQLQRRLGWANGVTRHHLDHLVRAGRLAQRRHGQTVRYFENHGRYDGNWQEVVAWRDPDTRWLAQWLAARPGAHQSRVVQAAAAERGWSRGATQRRLRSLVQAGLVRTAAQGPGQAVLYHADLAAVGGVA
jgi:hypothetical protein